MKQRISLKSQKIIQIIMGLSLLLFAFQNCDIKQPKVENLASRTVLYTHPTSIVSCQACHENDRPLSTTGNGHPSKSDLLVYTLDGTDPMDCIKCHDGAQNTGVWTQITATGDYHATATNCASCHGTGGMSDRTASFLPAGSAAPASVSANLLGGGHPSASMMAGKDCILCHTAPATSTRTTTVEDWLAGLKIISGVHSGVTDCQSCHKSPNQFDRSGVWTTTSPVVSPFAGGGHINSSTTECSSCHNPGEKSSDWSASAYLNMATFHATATECNSCHGAGQRKDRSLFQTSGPPASQSTGTGSQQTFTLTNKGGHPGATLMSQNGVSDCKSCHQYQTGGSFGKTPTTWAWNEFDITSSFHLSSRFPGFGNWNGTGTPSSTANNLALGRCATCHGAGQAFDRTIIVKATHTGGDANNITTDCTYCHTPGNQVSDWIGKSNFSHPTTYSNAGNSYCFNCHTAPSNIKLPPDPALKDGLVSSRRLVAGHLGAETPSSSNDCSSCHTIPGNGVTGWTQTDANGNVVSYPHKKINWTTGTSSSVTNCTLCHLSARQGIKVYKTESSKSIYKGEILLSSLALSGAQSTSLSSRNGHYSGGTGSSCGACHSVPTTTQQWTATHPTFTGDCNQCHVKAPTALVSKTGTHITVAAGGNCGGCHGLSTSNWADGKSMDHSGTTSCLNCHNFTNNVYTSPSNKVTGSQTTNFTVSYTSNLTETMAHDTTTNCKICHTVPSTTATTFTNTWTTYNHKQFKANIVTDVSCISCHAQAVANNVNSGANYGCHKKAAFKNGQCGMCHFPSSSGGWPSQKGSAHGNLRDGTYDCTYCHN